MIPIENIAIVLEDITEIALHEKKDIRSYFPYKLNVHQIFKKENNISKEPVGFIKCDFDTWNQMDAEHYAAEGTLQRDYLIQNYDKIEWV